ncbi:MAG: LrgB family protein [Bacteroidaceae bacterium]|nr:LrgB family protein [Bacteroidaceae bacterium]
MIKEFLENKYFLIAITFGFFWMSKTLQRRTGWVLLNPILLTIAILICLLELTGIKYATYQQGGDYISFWLQPAVVALGVPLYQQLRVIRRQLMPILLSQLAGCVTGLVSVVLISKWMGAPPEIVLSLAPKSVTTPIAMEVSAATGGIPSLTAAVVVITGLLGAVFGFTVLRKGRVHSPIAQGLSMGTASHAVGTSAAMEYHRKVGAYAGLGLTLNGIFTAILTPFVLRWIMG